MKQLCYDIQLLMQTIQNLILPCLFNHMKAFAHIYYNAFYNTSIYIFDIFTYSSMELKLSKFVSTNSPKIRGFLLMAQLFIFRTIISIANIYIDSFFLFTKNILWGILTLSNI